MLTLTTLPNQNGGPISVTVSANDQMGRLVASDIFDVTVTAVNDAPIVSDVSVSMDEDGVKSIIPDSEDIDSPSLSYVIVGTPAYGIVEVSGSYFTYTPSADYNGSDSFTYLASDGDLESNVIRHNSSLSSTVNFILSVLEITIGLTLRLCGATGVITKLLVPGIKIGPPELKEYPVEPVGVEIINPSAQ